MRHVELAVVGLMAETLINVMLMTLMTVECYGHEEEAPRVPDPRQAAAQMKADVKLNTDDDIFANMQEVPQPEVPRLKVNVRLDPQVKFPGGYIQIGSDNPSDVDSGAYPQRVVNVNPFIIDRYCVSNGDFMVFTRKKPRYLTEAEKRGYSWVLADHVSATAKVFDDRLVSHPSGTHWKAVRNATWFRPYGGDSHVAANLNQPAVHLSYRDAFAFCVWAGKQLPTEAEWEFAARAAVNGTKYPWGKKLAVLRANLWQGSFPWRNTLEDGYDGISPETAFPVQNKYGLYDMLGNVWEWTSTVYAPRGQVRDRNRPQYVVKGGSFADTRVNTASRMPLLPVYTAENVGFRCVQRLPVEAGGGYVPQPARRGPTQHRLKETWSYKVKQAFSDIITGRGHQHTEEL